MFSLLVLFISASQMLFAQTGTIKGAVSDVSGEALPGVNIQIKGTTEGTASDFDGNYEIKANQGDVLIFSFIGFANQEVTVKGSTLNVTLQEDANELDEVVITTAFGIEQSEKELGYSVTQVKTEDLDLVGQTSAISALQGRVAGLTISQSSGSAGGGQDILIRGMSSMNPNQNSQPLIIVDGLSINNDTFTGNILPTEGSNASGSNEQFAFSSRASDINPDDIETYNVLKGTAATALYGIRGANGVIVITTKKGKIGKPRININVSTTFSNVVQTPDLQKTFRQGIYGETNTIYRPDLESGFEKISGTSSTGPYNWGVRYSEDFVIQDGVELDLRNDRFYDPYELFVTGVNSNVNFNISGASDKMDYYFSVGNTGTEGIVPGTDYQKTSFRFKAGYQVSDEFRISSSIQYTNSDSRKATGGDKSAISALGYFSPTFPVNDYKNADGTQRIHTGWIDSPRYNSEVSSLTEDTNRWIGNVNLNWTPADWVSVNYTAQVDNFTNFINRFVPPELDTGIKVGGFIVDQTYDFFGLESNLIVTFKKDLSEKVHTSLTLGNSILDNTRKSYRMYGQSLNIPHYNHMSNTQENHIITNYKKQIRQVGSFGEFKIDYDNKLFLSITGRNDWDSTLPVGNNSFFYPSISLAYDVHSLFGENDIFTFGKIRGSYAEVGNGTTFGQTGFFFYPDYNFPWGGTGGYRADRAVGHPELGPERTKGWEIGTDLRFFNNRLRFDYAYYNSKVHDAIFPVSTPPTTGILSFTRNSGIYQVEGHELLISGDIMKTENFDWEMIYNFGKNSGTIVELPEEVPFVNFSTDLTGARLYLQPKEGDPIGTIYGYNFNRIDDGKGDMIIESDGLPRTNYDEKVIVGDATPDFTMSLGSNFRWKNFRFNFLVEWKEGGDKYSWQRYILNRMGQSEFTMQFRDGENGEYVFDGVMSDGSGGYVTNTHIADFSPESKTGYRFFNWGTRGRRSAEFLLQDASWVKLRNIGISYDVAGHFLEKLHINQFTISANASNILLWTPFDGFDPEGSDYSAGSNKYGFTGRSIPLTENYSFGVAIGF
ncbi:MAG: SusC/RagA family TonB-linked outer membrane protein [Flavobacteriaceae bacterium]|nr:SusC/RagA family TonB-linked outer membrane protein [Flavobacteriaceae bacterium]